MIATTVERNLLRMRLQVDVLDAFRAEELKRIGCERIDGAHPVALDLAEVGCIDSAGVGALIALVKHGRRLDQPVCLISVGEEVLRVLRLIRLDAILEVRDDFDAAVTWIEARARQAVPR